MIGVPGNLLLAPQLQVRLHPAGDEKTVLAERKIGVQLNAHGYEIGFNLDRFLDWSFTNERMPIGAFEKSQTLREALDLNHAAFAMAPLPENPPLVSVIMPVYNRETVVRAAIESVAAQTYRHLELIVVDDGSRDGSVGVVERVLADLADDRITFIRLPANQGVSAARNAGMAKARGTYFAYLDSDNTWDADYLRIMLGRLSAKPGYLSAYAGQEIWEYLPAFGTLDRRWVRLCPFNRSRLEERNFIDLNVFLHHRSLYDEGAGFREDMRRLVDWELILRYTEQQPPLFVPVLLCRYNVNLTSNQITRVESFSESMARLRAGQGPERARDDRRNCIP